MATHRVYRMKGEEYVQALIRRLQARWHIPRTEAGHG
jgi:hypothetical protein